jgi:glucose/arabinose dehydrogenase
MRRHHARRFHERFDAPSERRSRSARLDRARERASKLRLRAVFFPVISAALALRDVGRRNARAARACGSAVALALVVAVGAFTTAEAKVLCGDADGDGSVTDTDGVHALRAAAGLPTTCPLAACDVDRDGAVSTADARAVLRISVGVSRPEDCVGLPPLRLTSVASGLDQPLFVGGAPGDTRLYVAEQTGRVRIVADGGVRARAFLDLSALVSCCGERGLLGVAFHPGFAANGRFFVNYTDTHGDTVVAEYHRSAGDPELAEPEGRTLFTVAQPFANHNGGMLAFGPDGLLYVGLGDGGGGGDTLNNAQSLATKLGKILRIDVDTHPTPPPANFPGGDPDLWDIGLRNPFRFSFDRTTGDLYIGDVGQGRFEEVDVEPPATGHRNYGWRITEGFACFNPASGCDMSGLTPPVVAYDHSAGDCSVIGGYVYRGARIPGLVGRYLYGDFCSRRIRSFVLADGGASGEIELTDALASATLASITSFGEDEAGELYVVDGSGAILRVDPR